MSGKTRFCASPQKGKHISSFSLPAKSGFGDNEKTSWLNCKMFGAMAEKLSTAIVKGAKVTVTGEFVIEEWTKQDGSQAQTPTILVRDIDLPPRNGQQHSQQATPQPQREQRAAAPQPSEPPMNFDFDDDAPY